MAEKRFNVVFSGMLVEGRNPLEVMAKLPSVLDMDEQKVRELFSGGSGTIILKDLDSWKAFEIRDKLREVGAVCSAEEITTPESPEPPPDSMPKFEPPPPPSRPARTPVLRPDWQPPPAPKKGWFGRAFPVLTIIFVAALAGVGWWGYQLWLAPPSPAYQAYIQYSEAMARGEYQKAADSSSGEAKAYAEMRAMMTASSTMKLYGKEYAVTKPSVSDIAGDISWIKLKRKSERKKDDGGVVLQVEETVCRIPPGVSSVICKWPVTYLHDVEVAQSEGVWFVSSFKEERLTP